jgi:hypothetical protein
LDEIQQCAQDLVNKKLQNAVGLTPHHITVSGTRNLIPVLAQPVTLSSNTPSVPVSFNKPSNTPEVAAPPVQPTQVPPDVHVQAESPITASLATLKDIEGQSNPKRKVEVKVSKTSLKIGRDALDLSIKSSHDGYIQLVLVGSDAKSFYVLFPNGLDKDNRIRAGQTVKVPKPDWQVKSSGPEGTNHLLVLVTDAPRKLDNLKMAEPTAAAPFTFSLNDLSGRSALLDFLIGNGVSGKSESFGAKIVSIKEVP